MRLYNPQIAQLYYPLSHTPKALLTIVGSSSLAHKKASPAFRRSGALGHERLLGLLTRGLHFSLLASYEFSYQDSVKDGFCHLLHLKDYLHSLR
jgi:hypothetical protein